MKPLAFADHHVVRQPEAVTGLQHRARSGHQGAVVWLTGLPGSGKSTLARAAQEHLHQQGFRTALLDGDNLRHGLCLDLGFSIADRNENVRRTSEVAKLFLETGVVVFVALVSPIRSAREKVRQLLPTGDFLEIYCECSLTICQERDPKGHYRKAENGTLAEFTGVSSPYEPPLDPALSLDTAHECIEQSLSRLIRFLLGRIRKVNGATS